MQGEIAYLREQLEAERQAHAEARRIIAGLVERMPPQLETPQEAADASETVEDEPEAAEPQSATGEVRDELSAERTRRETAETTLQEGMAEQRRRREEAERERDDLREQLYARSRKQGAHEAGEQQQGRGQPRSDAPGAQEGARRPWWRRVLRR
jgi:hypothetical protein